MLNGITVGKAGVVNPVWEGLTRQMDSSHQCWLKGLRKSPHVGAAWGRALSQASGGVGFKQGGLSSASVSWAAPGQSWQGSLEGPLGTGLESAGQADMMSSVHLETTDPPSWVPSGSQALWPGSLSSALSLSPTLHIPGFQVTQPGPPGLPSKQLLLNSPTPSSLGSKQYNFKQRPLPQPWGKYWAGFSALLTVYFFLPTLSAKIEPEGPCLSPSPLPCPGLLGPGHGAHISQGSHECSRNVSSPKLGCSIPAPPSR